MAAKNPTEKTSTRALTGPRLLDLPIPSTAFTFGTEPTNGWQTAVGGAVLYNENYFDMAGLMLDDLTLVPTVTSMQDGLPYISSNSASMFVYDIISTERLDPEDFLAYSLFGEYPGSPYSNEDWNQIIMCNFRYMSLQTDFTGTGLQLPATGGSFGSQEPSAARKLWTYRVIIPSGDGSGEPISLSIPATRFIMGAEIVKEDDLPYMMRLKRSYEISTQG